MCTLITYKMALTLAPPSPIRLPVPVDPVCKAKICGLLKEAVGMNIKEHRIIGLINDTFEGSDRDLHEHGIYLKGLRKITRTQNLRIAGTPT
jgi:hypothetical protein